MEKLNAQYEILTLDKIIEQLSKEIRNNKSNETNFLALDLQKLIDKRDELFHSLEY